jgi:hypothetical protein
MLYELPSSFIIYNMTDGSMGNGIKDISSDTSTLTPLNYLSHHSVIGCSLYFADVSGTDVVKGIHGDHPTRMR